MRHSLPGFCTFCLEVMFASAGVHSLLLTTKIRCRGCRFDRYGCWLFAADRPAYSLLHASSGGALFPQ